MFMAPPLLQDPTHLSVRLSLINSFSSHLICRKLLWYTSKQPQASAQAALAQWKAAKFPASQVRTIPSISMYTLTVVHLLLGLPLYGYVSQSTKTALTGSLMPSDDMVLLQNTEGPGDHASHFLDGAHHVSKKQPYQNNEAGLAPANLQSWWGQQIPFSAIVKSGAVVKKSDGTYGEGGGFTMGKNLPLKPRHCLQ